MVEQQKLVLSPYMEIYDLVIPKDNLPRQIKELVDFGFAYFQNSTDCIGERNQKVKIYYC